MELLRGLFFEVYARKSHEKLRRLDVYLVASRFGMNTMSSSHIIISGTGRASKRYTVSSGVSSGE
jgi:hypothetical protein